MRDLNQAVREELAGGYYATMVAVGWHDRRGLMVITNAGAPSSSLVSRFEQRVGLAGDATRDRPRATGWCAAWPARRRRL
jgi:hypothetical protein